MSVIQLTSSPVIWKVQTITTANGTTVTSVVSLPRYDVHVAVDDKCWILFCRGKKHPWIFPDALAVLRKLPDSPTDYLPLLEFLGQPDGPKPSA